MSRLFSKKRVAVTVDQRMMKTQKEMPIGLCRLQKMEQTARQQKGRSEYPRMLIVEYSST